MINYDNQKYGRRSENYQNYPKNPNKTSYYHDNTYKKRDNSAILRRAINKRYKEDINKNNNKTNDFNDSYNEEDDDYDNHNPYKNNNKYINNEENENFRNNNRYNFNNINNVYNSNYNSYNNFIYTDNSNYNSNYNSNINSNYTSSPNYNSNDNYYDEYTNNNNRYDKSLLNRINHKRNKNISINMNMNLNNYYSTHISKDNIYDEFIIDYKSGINPNQNQTRNSLSRFNTQSPYISNQNPRNMNNTNYERALALNNSNFNREIYPTSNYGSNNNIHNTINQSHIKYSPFGEKAIDYNIPYQKRKINNYTYNPKKHAMMTKSNTNFNNKYNKQTDKYYYRNQSNNVSDDAFMENRQNNTNFKTVDISNNNYNRSYGGLNDDYNNYENNIDIGYKDIDSDPFQRTYNIRNNYMQEAQRRYLRQNFINRINEFTNHFSKYCVLYYYKVVVKLFKYLKENKNKNKYDIKSQRKNIMNKNKKNLAIKNKSFSTNRTNYHKYLNKPADTEPRNNKIPFNKNKTNIIIERIKSSNQSRSPESKDATEMYRNLNELSKKYEVISNRRNRLSNNNSFRRTMNDLSFNSENKSIYRNSVEKNKEKWEKTISKERKRRRKILEKNKKKQEGKQKDKQMKSKMQDNKSNKKDEKKNVSDLIHKSEELKAKIQQLKENEKEKEKENNNDKNIKNVEKRVKEFGGSNYNRNTISFLNREKIREKYKKKNLKNKAKDKNEMMTIKNIISKDKALYIDIKYLNYIPTKDKNNKSTNINNSYQVSDNFNINLLAVKTHNDSNKKIMDESKEKDNSIYKLSSIKEENKVEMDLSDDASQNSNENNSKI